MVGPEFGDPALGGVYAERMEGESGAPSQTQRSGRTQKRHPCALESPVFVALIV
jgi:hypothetical protein